MSGVGDHEEPPASPGRTAPQHHLFDGIPAHPDRWQGSEKGVAVATRVNKLNQFCDRLDIVMPQTRDDGFVPTRRGNYARIQRAIKIHFYLSFALKALAVLLVVLQLVLGITISVLTSLEGVKARTAVIVLGAINSFVGGLAGVLQYWGQPTREARYYAALEGVREDVDALIGKFKNPETPLDPWEEGDKIWAAFKQAQTDAFSSDPMIWLQGTKAPDGSTGRLPGRDGA